MKKTNIILKEFKAELEKLYGRRLKDVILYGSWARGEAAEDSVCRVYGSVPSIYSLIDAFRIFLLSFAHNILFLLYVTTVKK